MMGMGSLVVLTGENPSIAGAWAFRQATPEDLIEALGGAVGEAWMESTGDHTLSGWWTDHPLSEGSFYLIPKSALTPALDQEKV